MVEFIVEDGTDVPNANAYDTLENVTKYHANHGNTDWPVDIVTASPSPDDQLDELKSAIIRGSAYLDRKYGRRFSGTKNGGRLQSMQWPRTGAKDGSGLAIAADEVPVEIKICTAIASLRELVLPGSLMPDYTGTEQVKSETLGPLSVSYVVSSTTAADNQPVITEIDQIMLGFLSGAQQTTSILFGERG